MKIAFGQINPMVGDFEGNAKKIAAAYEACAAQGAELVVFPELAISGYPPEDNLLNQSFIAREQAALAELTKVSGNVPMILGATKPEGKKLYNAAYLLQNGLAHVVSMKTDLPNTGVFDEERYFDSGHLIQLFEVAGKKIGVIVCEDTWSAPKASELKALGAEFLVSINASPYEFGKLQQRYDLLKARATETGLAIAYVNIAGAQDEIVFDGGSFIVDAAGEVVKSAPEFAEFVGIPEKVIPVLEKNESRYRAMSLGLADYMRKTGFTKAVLGLSGGVDSAIVAVVAADVLGAENVRAVMLPSRFTSQDSLDDAKALAKNIGVKLGNIAIEPAFEAFQAMLAESFEGKKVDLTEENMQSRIRGVTLMALSNKFNELLLTTGNKSEIATGYSTLYGDSCGGYNILKDLYKTEVYEVCEWINREREVIPRRILTKAPTAELRENQKDQDSLPPYDVLDAILKQFIEGRKGAEEIIAGGAERALVERIAKLLRISEYKRRQAAPGAKLSSVSFGKDWRMPIAAK